MVDRDRVLAANIREQISFYFADSNLCRDQWLRREIKKHPEGYVELAKICGFKRMRLLLHIHPDLRPMEIPNIFVLKVAEALSTVPELEVSPEKTHVRRRQPFVQSPEVLASVTARTILTQPLPYDAGFEAVARAFQQIGPVRSVLILREPKDRQRDQPNSLTARNAPNAPNVPEQMQLVLLGGPKAKGEKPRHSLGMAFVEFETQEAADRAMNDGVTINFLGAPQQLSWKSDFDEEKKQNQNLALTA